MGPSRPYNFNSELVISYQTHNYNMGGLIIKKGYFVTRNGMRITHSFKTADEVFALFPKATVSDKALQQIVKDRTRQLDLFSVHEKRA